MPMTPEHQPISPFQIDVPAGGALSEIVIGAPTDPERCSLAGADLSDNSQVARELRIRARLNLESAKNLSHESVLARFHHAFEHIAQHALGYEAVIGQTKLALATGNHQLLIGGTGTGKSYYAKGVAGTLGADTLLYENQLSLETTEDALYGLIPMRRISDGKGSRNLDGSLVLADVAFLDEVFDARDELLRSMLWPLSDRLYHNGDATIESNLHAVIACGNYTRLNSKTEAFLDRFLFQSNISGSLSPLERQRLLRSSTENRTMPSLPPEERLSSAELRYIGYLIDGLIPGRQVTIAPEFTMLLDAVVLSFEERFRQQLNDQERGNLSETTVVSNRTLKQLGRVVTANAVLNGRMGVDLSDLSCLSQTLPIYGDRAIVQCFNDAWREVMRHAIPGELNVMRTMYALSEIIDHVDRGLLLKPLTIPQHILKFMKLTTERDVSFSNLLTAARSLKPNLAYSLAYQKALINTIEHVRVRSGRNEDDTILT